MYVFIMYKFIFLWSQRKTNQKEIF